MAEVPQSLKRLVRLVMRGFYGIEHVLVMDMLIRKPCMKEDDLEALLKFERKQLRTVIAQLKNDKMIKARLRMETGPDGKATKQNYHYINYKAFVSVVKYKLDHMRRKIETEERDSTSRASFICTSPVCKKTFTDLQAGELCDLRTGEFRCSLCGDPVIEDPNVLPAADSRLVLAKFNEQIEPLYLLLKDVEGMILPSEMVEPEISEPIKHESITPTHTVSFEHHRIAGFTRKGTEVYDAQMLQNSNATTVKIEDTSSEVITFADKAIKEEPQEKVRPKKEELPWLKGSTVFEEPVSSIKSIVEKENTSINIFPQHSATDATDSVSSAKEIMEALMNYEKQHDNSKSVFSFLNGSTYGMDDATDGMDTGANEDDEMMDTDDEEVDDTPLVSVGGQLIRICDVSDDHLDLMSAAEIDEYKRLSQELYGHLYDL